MAKAASADKMNRLHDMVATVFIKVVERYLQRLEVMDRHGELSFDDISEEILSEIFADSALPSAGMLAAITKFLKDNEVLFEKEKTEELSATKRALEEKMKNRPNLKDLTLVPGVHAN